MLTANVVILVQFKVFERKLKLALNKISPFQNFKSLLGPVSQLWLPPFASADGSAAYLTVLVHGNHFIAEINFIFATVNINNSLADSFARLLG